MKLRSCSLCLLGAVVLLLAGGCYVSTEQPLSDPKHARPDPALVGTWRSVAKERNQTPARIRFDERGHGCFEEQTEDGRWKTMRENERFFVTRTAHATYFNVADTTRSDQKGNGRPKTPYLFLKYHVSDDGKKLTIWTPKSVAFRQAVAGGKLKGRIEKSAAAQKPGRRDESLDGVALRDSPAAILRFMDSRPTSELFDEANVLKRID